MDIHDKIKNKLQQLTGHSSILLTSSGDAAIETALSLFSGTVLIPAEGGWLSYRKLPKKCGLKVVEVACTDAKIVLQDLEQALKTHQPAVFLYQNPGGYHAAQPMKEIYTLCQQYQCQVMMDVSGSIGTKWCNGKYADILVGSFGEWKLVDAGVGGFISWNDKGLNVTVKEFDDPEKINLILQKLESLPQRIAFLREKRAAITHDLHDFLIINKDDEGFVVVVAYGNAEEKEKIINYCTKSALDFTECPRYIRLNRPAISIEVKRLQ
ncbi:MAG: aminotransferase class I/II-fold pyridoxal phosphate-dependent enzyme [Nanoarchaeota archaeon]|nr:aminotransferase class I/II-fold pyridoxal phosphate-dependent enzyme [Nanoarchaeota archaeon]